MNETIAKYGPSSVEAKDAADKLSIAEDALSVSQERAKMMQDDQNQSIAQFGLMIAPTAITALASIQKLTESLPTALKNMSGSINDLGLSTKGLALSAAAAVGAFALGYTILDSLPAPMRTTAAVLAVVTGALVAGAIAAYAFWEGISLGTATPLVAASMLAVSVAAAGLTILIKDATATTNDYAAANNNAVNSLENLTEAEKNTMDAETTRYNESLDANTAYWNTRLGISKTGLQKIDDEIASYYNTEISDIETSTEKAITILQDGYNQELTDYSSYWNKRLGLQTSELTQIQDAINTFYNSEIDLINTGTSREIDRLKTVYAQELTDFQDFWNQKLGANTNALDNIDSQINAYFSRQVSDAENSYSMQISATNKFYDDLETANNAGLKAVQEGRSKDLDNLELNMLAQKVALEKAHDTGTLPEKQYQAQLTKLSSDYNAQRTDISDSYRLQELQQEKLANENSVTIEADRLSDVASAKQIEASTLLDIQKRQNEDLMMAQDQYSTVVIQDAATLQAKIAGTTTDRCRRR